MTDTMVVEEFATNPLVTSVDEHEAICKRLGLGISDTWVTSHRPEASAATRAARALEHYPEWKGRRLKAWRKFMPTCYCESAWYRYHFDTPPLRALKAIEAARATGLFDGLEIWTPENRALRRSPVRWMFEELDPVCVGVIENHFHSLVSGRWIFPIVRWGDEELVSELRVRLMGLFLRNPDHVPYMGMQSGVTLTT